MSADTVTIEKRIVGKCPSGNGTTRVLATPGDVVTREYAEEIGALKPRTAKKSAPKTKSKGKARTAKKDQPEPDAKDDKSEEKEDEA